MARLLVLSAALAASPTSLLTTLVRSIHCDLLFDSILTLELAGHMVPYNQPENALDMLNRFLNHKPFA